MLVEIILALLIGVTAGTVTGLIPGIHINLIAALLISSLAALPFTNFLPPLALVIFITSMAITHTFLDFIPSVYLGAPDEDSFLSVLPGHKMLKEGKAHAAVILTLKGSFIALFIILIFTPLFIYLLPIIQNMIIKIIPFILIFISLFLIFREEEFLPSLIIFLLASILGYLALNLPVKEPLLPLLTGLFGSSAIIVSLKSKFQTLPKQKIPKLNKIKLNKKRSIYSIISSSLFAPLCSFLPGIGTGHAAVLASQFKKTDTKDFLFMIGAINTIVMGLSFIALYSINRTRSGASVAINQILPSLSLFHLLIIILTIIISGILAFTIGINISKIVANKINNINYKHLSIITLIILFVINLLITNFLGIMVLFAANFLGIFTILSKSRRINLMGSLLFPTIIFYLI